MRRILIDDNTKRLAVDFKSRLNVSKGNHVNPIHKLKDLKKKLAASPQQYQYIQKIIDEWDSLIVAEPDFDNIISEFEEIIPRNDIETLKVGDTELYKLIVDAMEYDYVQTSIYPDFMRELGIKTCVYCNAQYALYAKDKRYEFTGYQLDHWKSKSKYPYLCTSFFNLQPCCAHCNQMKLQKDADFNLYTHDGTALNPMKFFIPDALMARFLCTHDCNDLEIWYDCENEALKENHEETFHIKTQYLAHKDVAEEIIWKKQIYNSTFLEIYRETFKKLGFSPVQFNRFIIGNYDKPGDVLKRPLAKMTQDIARQLKIIK